MMCQNMEANSNVWQQKKGRDVAVEGTGAEMWQWREQVQRCGSGGNRCRDVAVEGTGAEMWQWREQVQRCGSGGNRCRDVAVEGTGAEMWQWREQVQRCGSGGNRCRDVAVEGTDSETRTSAPRMEHRCVLAVVIHKGGAMCTHMVEAVLLLKE